MCLIKMNNKNYKQIIHNNAFKPKIKIKIKIKAARKQGLFILVAGEGLEPPTHGL